MQVEIDKIKVADSLWQKTWGVIGWKSFGDSNGLLLTNTNAVHTFLVRFDLDLVFLDQDYRVVKLVEKLKPFRFSPISWTANHILEMPANSIDQYKLAVGDKIILK